MLELKDVHKIYRMGDNEVFALRGVSLLIEAGDYVAIMGPSGSGKSTLMHILGFLDAPTSGSYQIEGDEVSRLNDDELASLRREKVGFIFQQFNLLPRMTALENVGLPLLYSKKKVEKNWCESLLQRVGLGARMTHRPSELSGGQQQRVAIARSLVNQAQIIFADEPTGNLDSASEHEIFALLEELNAQGITIVVVTHEEEIGRKAKRLIRMRDGVVQSDERLRPRAEKVLAAKGEKDQSKKRKGVGLFDFVDYVWQGLKALAANKMRTALSMLGILIGVAAVVAVLALGHGAKAAIETQLASLGSNLLVLRPAAIRVRGVAQETGATTRLDLRDVQHLQEQTSFIKDASPNVNGRGQVTFQNKNWSTQILGAGHAYAKMRAAEPKVGRFFTQAENQKRSRVAILGTTVVKELFGEKHAIGEMIKINKVNFQVIGILPEKGATSWRDQDDVIVVPIMTAMYRLLGKDYIDYIDLEIRDASQMQNAEEAILDLMHLRHRVPASQRQGAFEIRNMAELQEALSESSRTVSLLLSVIAAISLLVGGIGIMNIMLVSVTERTREVGLRKALGAKRRDILAQFLSESVVISAVGGLVGVTLGWLVTVILSVAAGWTALVSLSSILLALTFSASIGIIFGVYPAQKASKLHPIEALRYE